MTIQKNSPESGKRNKDKAPSTSNCEDDGAMDFDDEPEATDGVGNTRFARKGIWVAVVFGAAFGARIGAKFPSRNIPAIMAIFGAVAVAVLLLLFKTSKR